MREPASASLDDTLDPVLQIERAERLFRLAAEYVPIGITSRLHPDLRLRTAGADPLLERSLYVAREQLHLEAQGRHMELERASLQARTDDGAEHRAGLRHLEEFRHHLARFRDEAPED